MEEQGQEIKITIKSNYHGDLRRFVLKGGEELNSIYLQLMVSELYRIPLENVYLSVFLDSQRVEVTSDLLQKCTRKGITILRIDVHDAFEEQNEVAPALTSSMIPDVDMLRAACRTQVVELLSSKAFIDSIVDRVVPLVQKNMEQANPILSKSLLESTINDSVFKSVIQDDEESYEAVSDDDEPPPLAEAEAQPISDSDDESWSDSTATETDTDKEEEIEEDIQEDSLPNNAEEPVDIDDEAPQDVEDQDEESDPEDFKSFEVVKGEEDHQPEEPKKESRPIFKSLFAFIKEKTVDRIRPQNEAIKEEDIPNLEELLTRLDEMGFHDREVNMAALRFHRNFKEGLDEVIEDLLTQRSDQNPEPKEEPQEDGPLIESNPDDAPVDEAPSIEEDLEDLPEENDEPIESPQPDQEMEEPKSEMRGRLNSADVQRLVEAGMPKDMAIRTLLTQLY